MCKPLESAAAMTNRLFELIKTRAMINKAQEGKLKSRYTAKILSRTELSSTSCLGALQKADAFALTLLPTLPCERRFLFAA